MFRREIDCFPGLPDGSENCLKEASLGPTPHKPGKHQQRREMKCQKKRRESAAQEDFLWDELQVDGPEIDELATKVESSGDIGAGCVFEKWQAKNYLKDCAYSQKWDGIKNPDAFHQKQEKRGGIEQDVHLDRHCQAEKCTGPRKTPTHQQKDGYVDEESGKAVVEEAEDENGVDSP
mmetsp:Transcript_30666/g.49629  ORF Transcript_30666/g.49629 Transcript_30666/m.49629 type:complete len:177 (+) Transcript_30666:480-1010(+)|eukprot:CAMPEP_0184649148 /NCGR_PEP_ID=MMETSP0308-20130426/6431_1 /TAXON_ID=38269 /ORGANISM="Gloeochaete witrockiana, Strain SAG 46.84" /LENGTH=176 /DNA_ID=CAMNT_0027081607 /DNA_START=418 /DNA_END=948 /DNA_ORIENTATION=-